MNDRPIPTLYEDAHVLVVDKPAGLPTIPERDLSLPSVQRLLEQRRGERLWVVHRLDREVTGVLLFARDAGAHRALSMAFEHRKAQKVYVARVHRDLREGLLIDRPLREFGSGRMGVDDRRGKPSQTRIDVRLREGATTLVEARPLTGRRHQIRVHLYSIGHPIVGDTRYGDPALRQGHDRLHLHAERLSIEAEGLPLLEVACPLPQGF